MYILDAVNFFETVEDVNVMSVFLIIFRVY